MLDFLAGVPGKLKSIYTHLTTYLSSTRCAKIDNLDATTSSRAAASTALSNATWTDARAGYLDKLGSTPGILGTVKSVQYVRSMTNFGGSSGNVSAALSITAVSSTAKALVISLGMDNPNNVTDYTLQLTATNTVTVRAALPAAGSAYFAFAVVEFY